MPGIRAIKKEINAVKITEVDLDTKTTKMNDKNIERRWRGNFKYPSNIESMAIIKITWIAKEVGSDAKDSRPRPPRNPYPKSLCVKNKRESLPSANCTNEPIR